MTDRVLWNATAKRDRLQFKVQKLESVLAARRDALQKMTDWINLYHEFAGSGSSASTRTESEPSSNASEPDTRDPGGSERKRASGNPRKEVVAAAAYNIIAEVGQPVSRTDLYYALANRGIHINGAEPEQVLSTMLWRTQQRHGPIVRLKGGGYWLADKQHPESGYVPGISPPDTTEDSTREAKLQDAIHNTLMQLDLRELKNVEATMDFGGGIPDSVVETMHAMFPDVLDGESPTDDDFVALFKGALQSRLHAFDRGNF